MSPTQAALLVPNAAHAPQDPVDWSATPLGPRHLWSPALELAVQTVLASKLPMALRWGPDFITIYNEAYRPILGEKHPWAFARSARDIWAEIWDEIGPLHEDILSGRRGAFFVKNRPLLVQRSEAGPETAYFTISYSPAPDPLSASGIGGVLVSGMETTEQVRATARLEEAEARARHAAERLAAVLESTSDCVFVLDRDWRFTFMNQRAIREVAGGSDLTGLSLWEEYPHAVGSAFWDHYQHAMNQREPVTFEAYYPPPLANWYEVDAYPSEEGIAVFFRNINARRAAQEHQQLLINELNHRVKNTLATVQALACQSQRSAQSPEEANQNFVARLQALAAAHDVLTRENWEGADLANVVAGVTDLYQDRMQVHGPSVRLKPRPALSLAMALHELATNAVKYGALANETGTVQIRWLVAGPAGQHLHLLWQEQGGPSVTPPTQKGFGSRLIERGLASELGGKVETVYDPTGVRCSIVIPL